jgi:ADP-ribosylglycohydrolase
MDAAQITSVTFRGHGSHNQPAGTWSDDGALMLALLDSTSLSTRTARRQ